jgi:hypothetical protein
MDAKTQPNEIYIIEPYNALNWKQNNSNDVDEDTTQGNDDIVATKLLNIITLKPQSLSFLLSISKPKYCFYVDLPRSLGEE